MLETIFKLDRQLLLLINHFPHNFITNNFFLFFSIAGYYGIIWFGLLIILFLYDGLDNRKEMLALIIAVVFEIILVELVLKNYFMRVRPDFSFDSYSFPSGHATIAFAAAYIFSKQRKQLFWFFYLLAFFTAISRVYLGRHYPSDILAGAATGIFIGFLTYDIFLKKLKFKNKKKNNEKFK